MRTSLSLLAVAGVLALAACDSPVRMNAPARFGSAPSPSGCWSEFASTAQRPDFNQDLNDFALILRDTQDPGCQPQARTKLEGKMNALPLDYWKKWLAGGSLTMALAAALNIGYFQDIGPALDVRLRDAANSYQRTLQTTTGNPGDPIVCGVSGGLWNDGNTCLEDYAMGNTTYSWIAAYRRWTGRDWRPARAQAISEMNSTLAAVNSCIRYNSARANDPFRGVCNGTLAELRAGTASLLSFNHGYQTPAYGVGQMTSLAVGFVGLEVARATVLSGEIPTEQRDIAKALFQEGQAKACASGDWSSPTCYALGGGVLTPNQPCYDPPTHHPAENAVDPDGKTHYRADMFPVYRFYQKYGLLPTITAGQYTFQSFRDVFFETDPFAFFGPARKDFYGTMALTWLDSKPNMGSRPVIAAGLKRGSYYLSAATGGALQAIYTTRQVHGTFKIVRINQTAGTLGEWALVAVQNYQGYYLTTCNSTGVVTASATTVGTCEQFYVRKITEVVNPLAHGDSFALLAVSNNHYLRIPPGGNADVTATTAQSYETMVLERTNTEPADAS
jgi:hypothetical protein